MRTTGLVLTTRPRRERLPAVLAGVLAAIVLVLGGIWLGGHPSDLPSPLRSSVFEARRGQIVTQQALNILTTGYYRPLSRSKLVDLAGTTVLLTVRRDQAEHVIRVVRAAFAVPVATSRILNYHGVRIGYLRLTDFSEDSGDELRAEVKAGVHEHAQALILDLRGNGGGLIDQAINVTSIFLAHGRIMSAVERGQPPRV
jgi:hypothetical protein